MVTGGAQALCLSMRVFYHASRYMRGSLKVPCFVLVQLAEAKLVGKEIEVSLIEVSREEHKVVGSVSRAERNRATKMIQNGNLISGTIVKVLISCTIVAATDYLWCINPRRRRSCIAANPLWRVSQY